MGERVVADVFAELQWRNLVHDATPDLGAKLAAEPFTVYLGIDVTADSLHVGHLLGVITLQRLQRAGHRPIAVLGGATSLIGDPSFRATERRLLADHEIEANAAGIRAQLQRFLDFGTGPRDARLANNADWLTDLRFTEFLRQVGRHFSVNVMIAKESVRARLEEREQGITYAEFSYMLLQAYDFLHLFDSEGCRLQAGGSDQWGNITAGIELVRRARGGEAHGLTWPLVTKSDGSKFGKSEEGTVWLDPARTSPYQFFQFWLRTDDRDAGRYLRQFTHLGREDIETLEAKLDQHPEGREAQRTLAFELTSAVHGRQAAIDATKAAAALFGHDLEGLDEETLLEIFAEAPSSDLSRDSLGSLKLVDLLAQTGVVPSKSAARSAVSQGGAYVNNRRDTDIERTIDEGDLILGQYLVLRHGKKSYHLVRFR